LTAPSAALIVDELFGQLFSFRRIPVRFRHFILVYVVLLPGSGALPAQAPVSDSELKKLSGTFTLVQFVESGKPFLEAELKKMKVTQTGGTWKFHYGKEVTEGKDVVYPDKTPKEIDATYTNGPEKGKTVKGIYEIDGDTIKYCYAPPGKDRPRAFISKPGSGHTLMILKRLKEEPRKD
jgi:uncharacterized protein (TIGR03067 family)